MDILNKYFSELSELQIKQFGALQALYKEWNEKINVISRKDIDNLYERHVLHSLALTQIVEFNPGTEILDLGTGGGFPGIPLAIYYPKVKFTLIDGTLKKTKVVAAVAEALGLENVYIKQKRAEEEKKQFDFVVSRAVASLDKLSAWSEKLVKKKQQNALPNGLIALKGGDPDKELKLIHPDAYFELFPLGDFFEEAFFDEKYAIYIQL